MTSSFYQYSTNQHLVFSVPDRFHFQIYAEVSRKCYPVAFVPLTHSSHTTFILLQTLILAAFFLNQLYLPMSPHDELRDLLAAEEHHENSHDSDQQKTLEGTTLLLCVAA